MAAAAALYTAAVAHWISHGVSHFEQLSLLLQVLLLLPASLYLLREFPGGAFRPETSASQFRTLALLGLCFLLFTLPFSFWIGRAIVFADESSYRFQAQTFDQGRMMAVSPPGAAEIASQTLPPVAFKHLVLNREGWFSKYPIGWPLVLAAGEKIHLGWAVNPILGAVLLLLIAAVAKEAYGTDLMVPAVWMAVLSPYVLSYTTGRMSHGLCSVLVAAAYWFCLRGMRTGRLSNFVWMFAAMGASFHVRPFTAFLITPLLSIFPLIRFRHNRPMLIRLVVLTAIAGLFSVGSVLLYNHLYTGRYLYSPYALYDGTKTPTDVNAHPLAMLKMLVGIRRFSLQTTLLYSFPLVFLLAGYGFWQDRRTLTTWLLASVFPVVFIGHLAQAFGSSPIVGERYYFESYFSVLIMGALGLKRLTERWGTKRSNLAWGAAAFTAVQVGVTAVALDQINRVGKPYQQVAQVAQHYDNCRCVVFLQSTPDLSYFNTNMNLNRPEWQSASVFFLNDPGDAERAAWATRFGRNRWVVLSYDQTTQIARADPEDLPRLP